MAYIQKITGQKCYLSPPELADAERWAAWLNDLENERAIACYRKAGFQEIGRRREATLIGGRPFDTIFMDILATEFRSPFVTGITDQPRRA